MFEHPPLHTSETGSFAHDTLKVRVPEILAKTRAQMSRRETIPREVNRTLDELDDELRAGRLRGLIENAPDRRQWDRAVTPHLGRSWLDLPWYFAESYFYRRLVEATGFFGNGPLRGRDPFAADKASEWVPHEAPRRCAELLAAAPSTTADRLRALLMASLWGNRADLSYNVALKLGAYASDSASDLIADDTAPVMERILAGRCPRVTLIGDNAGTELLMDLALVDHLLRACGVERVDLHLKTHPFFVSDTMISDIDDALAALMGSGDAACATVARRTVSWRETDRLRLSAHPFYTSSSFYDDLPDDLRATLAEASLVILKGDANYRRLCSDSRWPHETPFAQVVARFPAPLVALRTLKAEVVVGLAPGQAQRIAASDPHWLVNGRRGVIQARL